MNEWEEVFERYEEAIAEHDAMHAFVAHLSDTDREARPVSDHTERFAENVRRLRRRAGISAEELADRAADQPQPHRKHRERAGSSRASGPWSG